MRFEVVVNFQQKSASWQLKHWFENYNCALFGILYALEQNLVIRHIGIEKVPNKNALLYMQKSLHRLIFQLSYWRQLPWMENDLATRVYRNCGTLFSCQSSLHCYKCCGLSGDDLTKYSC
jgi:hypothetical protein